VKTIAAPELGQESSSKTEGLYHVIILNDDDHTIDYVVEMLQAVLGLALHEAMARTLEADSTGSSIVRTCALSEAERKRDLIHAYGPDWRLPRSRGSIAALVEPAAL
jgi:ATP-dependent Clp protease adaptor protein ClpS